MQTYGFEIEHCGLSDGAIGAAITDIEHPTEGPAAFLGCFGYHGSRHLGLRHHHQWVAERDCSVRPSPGRGQAANEVVSPVLHGIDGLTHLKRVMASMKRAGAYVNRSCGLHVTLGLRSSSARFERMSAVKQSMVIARTVEAYDWFQRAFDELVSQSRRAGSPNDCRYAPNARFSGRLNLYGVPTPESARQLVSNGVGRGVVNIGNYRSAGTIEFRQHNGTMSGHKIEAFALLLHRLTSWAVMNPNGYDVRNHEPTFDGLMEMLTVGTDLKARLVARREQVLASSRNWFNEPVLARKFTVRARFVESLLRGDA